MNTTAFKVSWIILLTVYALSIVAGLIMAIAPAFFLAGEFEGYTGQAWAAFGGANLRALAFFTLEGRQMGLFMIPLGVALLAVALFAYRKGERWAWYLFLFSSTVALGGSLSTNLPTGDVGVIALIALLLLAGCLALGAKPILCGSPDAAE